MVRHWEDKYPIEIDVGCQGNMGFEVCDGNHRLAAAMYLRKRWIWANMSGDCEWIKEYLWKGTQPIHKEGKMARSLDEDLREEHLEEDDEVVSCLPGYETCDETLDHETFYDRVFGIGGEEPDQEDDELKESMYQ